MIRSLVRRNIVRTLAIHRPANPQVCWMDNSLSKQRHEPPTRVLQYYYIRGNAFQDGGGQTDGNYIKYYCYYCVPSYRYNTRVPQFFSYCCCFCYLGVMLGHPVNNNPVTRAPGCRRLTASVV